MNTDMQPGRSLAGSAVAHRAPVLFLLALLLLALATLAFAARADAAGIDSQFPVVHSYFPHATRFGAVSGKPPAAPVYQGDKVVGYVFQTKMVAPVPAYSGEPVNILVAIDLNGRIIGTKVLEQHEPILLVGIPVQRLYRFRRALYRPPGHRQHRRWQRRRQRQRVDRCDQQRDRDLHGRQPDDHGRRT